MICRICTTVSCSNTLVRVSQENLRRATISLGAAVKSTLPQPPSHSHYIASGIQGHFSDETTSFRKALGLYVPAATKCENTWSMQLV